MFEFQWMTPLYDGDGGIGASSAGAEPAPASAPAAAPNAEPPSVAAGGNEPPASGNAPAAGAADEPAQPDVTQQSSFAARLKEERGKIEQEFAPIRTYYEQLERVAKEAQFPTVEAYLQALDESVKSQRIADEAKKFGVDEDTYREFFAPVHDELAKTKSELQSLKQADIVRQVQADDQRLSEAYPDYKELREQVFEIAEKRFLPLEDAYKLVSWEARQEKARIDGQNAAVAALQANSSSSTGPAGGDAPNQEFDFTKLTPDQRKDYYEKAKRGELKSLR